MKLIDTHSHLYLEEFDLDRSLLISEAKKSGIEYLLTPNVDSQTIKSLRQLCCDYPDFALPMMGLHPTSVTADYKKELLSIEKELSCHPYIGIGEIGLDLYWDKTYLKQQKDVLKIQLEWSKNLNLPVVLHVRDAFNEIFELLDEVGIDGLSGVFHSFTGTIEDLQTIENMPNFMIGINGVLTFKNAHLEEVIQDFDVNRILLETDAPYLSPVPYRGKRNEPIYIWETAEHLAKVYKMSLEQVVNVTRNNTLRLFKNIK